MIKGILIGLIAIFTLFLYEVCAPVLLLYTSGIHGPNNKIMVAATTVSQGAPEKLLNHSKKGVVGAPL